MNNALLYAITVAIWGASWYGITLQLGGAAPEASVAYRFALAALILVAWCGVRGLSLRFSAREHGFAALMGFFIFCFSYILFYYAAGEVTSGLMALSFSSLILFNGLFGVLFLGSPMRPRVAFGAIVGIAGIGLVFWLDLAGLGGGRATLGGMAFCVLATVSVSHGNIISARNQLAGMPVLQTNAFGMAYAAALVAVYQPVEKGVIDRVSRHGEAYRGEGGFAILRDDEDDLNDQDGSSGRNKHEQGANSARHGLLRGAGADELAHQQR